MERKRKISQYRERLDKTLASPELRNQETLKQLVKNQLLLFSNDDNPGINETVLERKTVEVYNFLGMLRSCSVNETQVSNTSDDSHGQWKLKQDTEEFRVMYREGPEGTPYHSLLVEGYVDASVDSCLCVSWESALYRKWWPQHSFPPFKITSCKCLQKVRIGEQISLVRVKVTWPLTAREAIVHYLLFEYLQDDLIVVLTNTISDLKSIDVSTHGFSSDGIPEANDVVRIDLVGGFALQKVSQTRSYFRTIANMDMKVDFVPPTLINFIARQLIGNGFKLYQKAVASVSTHDEDFRKTLEDPLYTHIRKALYSTELSSESQADDLTNNPSDSSKDQFIEIVPNGGNNIESEIHNIELDQTCESSLEDARPLRKIVSEIEEEKNEESLDMDSEINEEENKKSLNVNEGGNGTEQSVTRNIPFKRHLNGKTNVPISHDVEQALKTLDKAIQMARKYGINSQHKLLSGLTNGELLNSAMVATKDSKVKEEEEKIVHESRSSGGIQDVRNLGLYQYSRETNHKKIAPATSDQHSSSSGENNQTALDVDNNMPDNKQTRNEVICIGESNVVGEKKLRGQKKKNRYCCFSFSSD